LALQRLAQTGQGLAVVVEDLGGIGYRQLKLVGQSLVAVGSLLAFVATAFLDLDLVADLFEPVAAVVANGLADLVAAFLLAAELALGRFDPFVQTGDVVVQRL
jgi:energy-converting hydrogenase Eha subunit C